MSSDATKIQCFLVMSKSLDNVLVFMNKSTVHAFYVSIWSILVDGKEKKEGECGVEEREIKKRMDDRWENGGHRK